MSKRRRKVTVFRVNVWKASSPQRVTVWILLTPPPPHTHTQTHFSFYHHSKEEDRFSASPSHVTGYSESLNREPWVCTILETLSVFTRIAYRPNSALICTYNFTTVALLLRKKGRIIYKLVIFFFILSPLVLLPLHLLSLLILFLSSSKDKRLLIVRVYDPWHRKIGSQWQP